MVNNGINKGGKLKRLDIYGKKILYELCKDGRISQSQIAKKISKSKSFVLYRLRKLKEKKILLGHTLILDPSKLGYHTYYVYLRIVDHQNVKEKDVIAYLKDRNEIYSIQKIIGKYQIFMSIFAKNVMALEEVLISLVKKFEGVVVGYRMLLLYSAHSSAHNFIFKGLDWIHQDRVMYGSEKIPVSNKSLQLIKTLSLNPRMSLSEAAEKMNSSLGTVRVLLKNLMDDGVIVCFRPSINPRALGYLHKHVTFKLKFSGLDKLNDIKNYLVGLRSTKFVAYSFGNYDMTAAFVFEDLEDFRHMQQLFFSKFGKHINYLDYHDYYEEIKYTHLPPI